MALKAAYAGVLDQALGATASPTFDKITLSGTGLVVGASTPFSDVGGVLTLQNIDAIDATCEAAILGAFVDADPTFRDLLITGDLTVQGTTTTIDSTTLLVEDKNIELGVVDTPTDLTADGGGITLKGTTDKTIKWLDAIDAWTFNQNIDLLGNNLITTGVVNVGNLLLGVNLLTTTSGDLDVTTATGGVFKFVSTALRAGLDAANYLEMGHGGSNSFLNQVGAGGMDFRFGGSTKATFTPAGHLHLMTDVDQKHTLKIITANNLNDTGIAWENSGGSFTHTIFRTDVGSNRADLVFAGGQNADIDLLMNSFKIHGSAAKEGRLEVLGALQISSGVPGVGKVLTSDAEGLANWTVPPGGGWTDVGTTVRLVTSSDRVGIGTGSPNAKLDVTGTPGIVVGGFASGQLHVTDPSTLANANAVITGHNSFGGNKQLWYFGSVASSNDNIAFINRQAGSIAFFTSNATRMTIDADGLVGIGVAPTTQLHVRSTAADTVAVSKVEATGASGAAVQSFVGTRDPEGLVTGNPGDQYRRASGVNSDLFIHQGASAGTAGWRPAAGPLSIFAQLSDSTNQEPSTTNPTVITFNTQDNIAGMTHSTSVNPGEITVDTAGVYSMSPQPQVGKTSGGTAQTCDMFVQVDTGSGFVDKVNSTIKITVKDSEITDVIIHTFTLALAVGDKIRFMQRVSSSVVGMGLKATTAEIGPPTIPATPSVILSIHRVGD